MKEKVLKYIQREDLIHPGDRILLAVSGGPDSVCLFHLFLRLQAQLKLSLAVAHINHGLRGSESDEEEQFVEQLARTHDLPFYSIRVSIPELSLELGVGTEEAARRVRYEFFERIMKEAGCDKTALAHNLNDQAETILHRMIRGSGLNGLAGMRPVRDDVYIRPLLETSRSEIEAWLDSNGLEYRIDSSNLVPDFTRNKIRLELLPQLMQYNPRILDALSSLSESLAEDRDYLETQTGKLAQKYLLQKGSGVTIAKEAFSEHRALTSRMIFEAIHKLKGNTSNISSGHIRDVLLLQKGETGRSLDLPDRVLVYSNYGDLEFSRESQLKPAAEPDELLVDLSKLPVSIDFGSYEITVSNEPPPTGDPSGRLDQERLGELLFIRTRREQDSMKMLGMEGYKKVRKIFIDKKIHQKIRDKVPVFLDKRREIAFIYPGICGEAFRITELTDKIIYITVTENENESK